jgi:uncharacterized membrane protein YfcA
MIDFIGALLIGLTAGIASGVAGIGGGVVMVPGMVFLLSMDQHLAQGTSLLAIIFTAISGTRVNVNNSRVELRSAVIIGAIGAATSFAAALLANQLDGDLLRRLFGALLLFSGSRMALNSWRSRG